MNDDDEIENASVTEKDILDIIDKIKSKEKFDFKNLSDDILMYRDSTFTTVLEYLIENNYINNNTTPLIGNVYDINSLNKALIFQRYGLSKILQDTSQKILMKKVSDDKTLFDFLLESNMVEKRMITLLDDDLDILNSLIAHNRWDLVNIFDVKMLIHTKINDKIVIRELFERKSINTDIFRSFFVNNDELLYFADLCIKYDKKELLKKVSSNYLLYTLENGISIIEFLFQNNLVDKEVISKLYSGKDLVNLCQKYNKMELLAYANENALIFNIEDNKTILEYLIEHNSDIPSLYERDVNKKQILLILIKLGRFDILSKIRSTAFFEMFDLNKTILDVMLDYYQSNNSIDINEYFISCADYKNYKVQTYFSFANHDMVNYLPKLDKEKLLSKFSDEKNFLEELLSIDPILTNKILSDSVKEDFEIALILKQYGIDQDEVDIELEKDSYVDEFLSNLENNNIDFELTDEQNKLINEFKNIMSDGESSSKLIDKIINIYRALIYENNIYGCRDLLNLIQIKKAYPEFKIVEGENNYYLEFDKTVCISIFNKSAINHELGHAMHYLTGGIIVPDGYEELIASLASDPQVLEKIGKFSKEYSDIYEKNRAQSISYFARKYDEIISPGKEKEIEQLLAKSKEEKRKELESKGYPKETLNYLLEREFNINKYRVHYIKSNSEELFNIMMRSSFFEESCICDILDAIYCGKLHNGMIKEYDIDQKRMPGHGIIYYKDVKKKFTENIANYAVLLKSPRCKESINRLTEIVGPEFITMLQDYYDNILTIQASDNITK